METVDYQSVVSVHDINKLPISITTTEVNLTGSWRFAKPEFREKISPCSAACPVHTNIPRYIFYLLRGDILSAAKVLRDENPFPATCGRVCPHFCQSNCNRERYDNTVQIREIEKFVGDRALNIPYETPATYHDESIAVIGGGPAGLSCAYFLAKEGYNITIYERETFLGGLLVYGIPEFRLPHDIVNKEIGNILSLGNITVKLDKTIGKTELEKIAEEYDAVFFSVGLGGDIIPTNIQLDNDRIFSGYKLLKKLNTDSGFRKNFTGNRVAVIGGGNVAFDVARTILRLNNDVVILYRRTLKEAPSFEEEKEEGTEEGLKIREKRLVTQVEKGEQLKLRLSEVIEISKSGIKTRDIGETMEVDKLIIATGQTKEFDIGEHKNNVLIGGDYAYGARTVIEAIASGKSAAFKIMDLLGKKKTAIEEDGFFRTTRDYDTYEIVPFERINTFYFNKETPITIKKISPQERVKNFSEVTSNVPPEDILREAGRCFSCGVCNLCKTCWFSCPDLCVNVKNNVKFDYDYCKGCGLCSSECPRGVIDMVEEK